MKNLIISALVTCLSITAHAGGPWPQMKGKGYFKLSEWWVVFDQHRTDNGRIDPNTTMGLFNTTLYGEYGLGGGFTAIVNAPLFSRTYSNNVVSRITNEVISPGEVLNSVGDFDLSLKYSLKAGDIPISATLLLGFPSGTAQAGTLGNLQTGDNEFNQMLRFDAGFSRPGNLGLYATAYSGFNNRTNNFSDEIRAGVEVGFALLGQKVWIATRLDVVESLKNGATAETITSSSVFANNTEFASIGLEANFYITEKLGVSAGVAGAFRGEIIAAAPSYSVGVFLDLTR